MESCHLAAARRVNLWSLNANSFFDEPHQLTEFAQQFHLNHIWRRKFPFKALIAIFWDLQPLWPSSLTKHDLLRFRCSSGHVLCKRKSVTPHFFYISDITNSSSLNGKMFRKKSRLENFRPNVLKPWPDGLTSTRKQLQDQLVQTLELRLHTSCKKKITFQVPRPISCISLATLAN